MYTEEHDEFLTTVQNNYTEKIHGDVRLLKTRVISHEVPVCAMEIVAVYL